MQSREKNGKTEKTWASADIPGGIARQEVTTGDRTEILSVTK